MLQHLHDHRKIVLFSVLTSVVIMFINTDTLFDYRYKSHKQCNPCTCILSLLSFKIYRIFPSPTLYDCITIITSLVDHVVHDYLDIFDITPGVVVKGAGNLDNVPAALYFAASPPLTSCSQDVSCMLLSGVVAAAALHITKCAPHASCYVTTLQEEAEQS